MYESTFMHILDTLRDLSYNYRCRLFWKYMPLAEQRIQFSVTCILHEEINILVVGKAVVYGYEVGMVHVKLYLDLSDNLVDSLEIGLLVTIQ